MAHQYITVENQTLLWKTVHRSPQFTNNTIAINREQWFSNIIKQFYENIKSPSLSIADLKALNQQTIAYMVGDLKRIESQYMTKHTNVMFSPDNNASIPNSQNYVNQTMTNSYGVANSETVQTRMSMYTDQFNARQQEYTNMVKPPAPPIANFTEKVEEEPITNMDELLQQQIKQREYDIAQARPPPPTSPNKNDGNITSEPLTLSPLLHIAKPNENGSPKSIQYSTNLESMNAIIQDLTRQLTELRDEIRVIKESQLAVSCSDNISPLVVKQTNIQLDRTEDVEEPI